MWHFQTVQLISTISYVRKQTHEKIKPRFLCCAVIVVAAAAAVVRGRGGVIIAMYRNCK
jgi:hypothetical protein